MLTSWLVEIEGPAGWMYFAGGFKTRDEAETCVAAWKQKHDMYTDPFRYTEEDLPF